MKCKATFFYMYIHRYLYSATFLFRNIFCYFIYLKIPFSQNFLHFPVKNKASQDPNNLWSSHKSVWICVVIFKRKYNKSLYFIHSYSLYLSLSIVCERGDVICHCITHLFRETSLYFSSADYHNITLLLIGKKKKIIDDTLSVHESGSECTLTFYKFNTFNKIRNSSFDHIINIFEEYNY